MKTKLHLILSCITALASTTTAFAEEKNAAAAASATVSGGSAVITIDANGRKETKVIKIGDENTGASASLHIVGGTKSAPMTWLGVVLDEVTPAMASQLPLDPGTGLLVEYVTADSPAAKAGLQKHDVLVRLGDQVLITPKQLQTLVANRKAGDTVEITFLRKGQSQTVTATLATHQPGDGLADHGATINLSGVKMDIDRLMKDAHDTAGSIILNSKTVFIGPDGKPVTIDSDEIREKTLEMLRKSGLNRETLDQVKRAFSEAQAQVRKAQEQAQEAIEKAKKGLGDLEKPAPGQPK